MSKLIAKSAIDRLALSATLVLVVVVGTVVISANASRHTRTGSSQLYLAPAKSTLTPGTTFTAQVRENSGAASVNAVQANFTYPADKLQFNGISDSGSAFGIAAQASGDGGAVKIARGSTTAVSGDQLVATVSFTILPAHGQADLSFTGDSALITSTDNSNMLTASAGGSYRIGK